MDRGPPITRHLSRLRDGDVDAWDDLLPLVYEELRRVAQRQIRRAGGLRTLNTTALVHEAYLRLAAGDSPEYEDRIHFLAVASKAMRHVLIDYARRHQASKRGGKLERVPLDEARIAAGERADTFLALDQALTRLETVAPRLGRVVECRFFGGMTEVETAASLGVTERTVRRDWTKARLWLYDALRPDPA